MTKLFIFLACWFSSTTASNSHYDDDLDYKHEDEHAGPHLDGNMDLFRIRMRTKNILRKIPTTLFGLTPVYAFEKDAYWEDGQHDQFDHFIEDAFWRYPGGEVTSVHHWEHPTGRGWQDSWDPWKQSKKAVSPENWMSLDEYWKTKEKIHAKALLGINARSGWKWGKEEEGLAEANQLAQYVVETKGWDVNYWFVDNEQYMGEDMWSAALYAKYINKYAAEIKQWQPEAKFVASWGNSVHSWKKLLHRAGDNIQMMDLHVYWNRHGWGSLVWSDYASVHEMEWYGNNFRDFVDSFKTLANDYGHNGMEVGFLEWGIGPSPEGEAPSRYQTGMITADMFMQMIDSNLDSACYWPYRVKDSRNAAYHRALVDDHNRPTFVHNVLSLFKTVKGYNLISSTNNERTKTVAAINDEGNRIIVYVLLKGDKPEKTIINDLDGFIPTKVVAKSFYAPKHHDGTRNTDVDYAPLIKKRAWIDDLGRVNYHAHGWSLTRLILSR